MKKLINFTNLLLCLVLASYNISAQASTLDITITTHYNSSLNFFNNNLNFNFHFEHDNVNSVSDSFFTNDSSVIVTSSLTNPNTGDLLGSSLQTYGTDSWDYGAIYISDSEFGFETVNLPSLTSISGNELFFSNVLQGFNAVTNDLNQLLYRNVIPEDTLFNNTNTVVSVAFNNTPAVIPVPAAIWFMASGLLGLVGFSRKTKPEAVTA